MLRMQDYYRMNIPTYRETLRIVELSYECTNILKTLGRQDKYRANLPTRATCGETLRTQD